MSCKLAESDSASDVEKANKPFFTSRHQQLPVTTETPAVRCVPEAAVTAQWLLRVSAVHLDLRSDTDIPHHTQAVNGSVRNLRHTH